jgi:hemolysin III
LLAGGVAYTVGAVLYGKGKKKRYFHSVFHIFVDLGSILQAICILFYVL